MFKKLGPGVLVAAAFIGPGTVTACTLAGVQFGYALLWALLISILATVVLQEMSARLGIITQRGLADVIKNELHFKWIKYTVVTIILVAIVLGNAAYEAGNIGGAMLGLEAIFGTRYAPYYPYSIGSIAFVLLFIGNYKILERIFVALVVLMSLSFIITAIITGPALMKILEGLLLPTLPSNSILTIVALVGTTVVPYNLFLHASLVSEKWKTKNDLQAAKWDTVISVLLGGTVSLCIVISAAAIKDTEILGVLDLAKALEPLYGNGARYCMGVGLVAAGITSAITAPLAAAYVTANCFGWTPNLRDTRFKVVWMLILGLGIFFLSFNIKPIQIIKFAQIANGILLPVIAIFLVWATNRRSVMGRYKNSAVQNITGFIIIGIATVLGVKSVLSVFVSL